MMVACAMPTLLGNIARFPMVWRDDDWMAPLLILFLGIAMGVCFVGLLLVLHFLRPSRRESSRPHPVRSRSDIWPVERRWQPLVLGVRARWLAVKCDDPQLVQAALRLHNPTPCTWEEGLSAVHEQKLFISPPMAGWVLVLGPALPEPAEDVDRSFHFLLELSRKVGQVQFFSVHRVLNHHAWIQVEHGLVRRAYAWAGRTLWHQGPITRAELELDLKCLAYGEPAPRVRFGQLNPVYANTERVPLLAARWSIDPASLDARSLRESQGIAGELSLKR